MNNPMDNMQFYSNGPSSSQNNQIVQQYQNAMKNPQAFVEHIARTNPQAYQKAMQIARGMNPQQVVMQMLQARGMAPGMFNLPGI